LIWTAEGSGSAELLKVFGDYYNEEAFNESYETTKYTVNFNGVDYTNCEDREELVSQNRDGDVETTIVHFSHKVPKGYDGKTIALMDSHVREAWTENSHADTAANENTLFFRIMP